MTRRLGYALCVAATATLVAPAAASAGPSAPTITFFSPRQAKIGEVVTVRGRNYLPGRGRTTLVLLPASGGPVFVKADQATSRRLKVRLPARLLSHMNSREGVLQRTRFRLRVLARRAGERFTPGRAALVVIPPANSPGGPDPTDPTDPWKPQDCDGDGRLDGDDANDDNDLLDDDLERSIGTQVCNTDSDADGLEDGWEYYSAKDLNTKALPYPGQRAHPNALDGTDASTDFDGDSLTMSEEYRAWVFTNKRFDPERTASAPLRESPLFYSDGTPTSRPQFAASAPGETPNFRRFAFTSDPGIYGGGLYPSYYAQPDYRDSRTCTPDRELPEAQRAANHCGFLDTDGNGEFGDDERDADNDGLNNFDETHGNMRRSTWNKVLETVCDPAVKPWEDRKEGSYYGAYSQRPFAEPRVDDRDSDGDSLLDGEDDQDNDDVPNYSELDQRCADDKDGGNVHPYNPCAPYESGRAPAELERKSCPRYKPL